MNNEWIMTPSPMCNQQDQMIGDAVKKWLKVAALLDFNGDDYEGIQ